MKSIGLIVCMAMAICSLGCGGSGMTSTGNPMVAQYTVSAPAGSSVAVQFGLDTNYGLTTSSTTVPAGTTNVTILVAGMKANSPYHMRAVTTLADGTQDFDPDRVFETGAPPSGRSPSIAVSTPSGGTPMAGVEVASLNPGMGSQKNNLEVVALDPAGDIIWYYDYDATLGVAQPIKLLPNGHFLMVLFVGASGPGGVVREVDLTGKTIQEFTVADLNTWLSAANITWTANAIHHDFVELPNGHLLLLVNINKDYSDLPGYPGTTTVLGDAVVDLDQNFNPVWTWSSFDHLDVNRHPMQFPDWTHSNAILYSADDGNIVLSMRHQSWILKIDYANGTGTGNVLWKLGYQGDFTLLDSTTPADWFFAQHFANIISPNTTGDIQVAMFDNGDNRVLDSSGTTCGSAGAAACYSRPAIFEVNETALTAQVQWFYIVPYSFWGGVIQELPNNDMFFDITTPADNPTGARVMEVTQEASPQVVWQVDVNGQNSYRTIHLPSLYPGVQW